MATARPEKPPVRLPELLGALSLATDLAMNFPPETALRTCLLSVNVGRALALSEAELDELFYVSLLRHIGCTAFSHEEGLLFGDDNAMRANFTGIDSRSPTDVVRAFVRTGEGWMGGIRVASRFAAEFGTSPGRLLVAHCDASRQLARQLGMTHGVVRALDHIFERWDGKGHLGLTGESIALSARVTIFTHSVILEVWRSGPESALAMVRRRAGHEFDPSVADAYLHRHQELLEEVAPDSVWDSVLNAEPTSGPWLPAPRLNALAEAFALFTDLKSAYTVGHCQAVARLVEAAASAMRLDQVEVESLRRAALLHNIGRLAVPSGIWAKPSQLNPGEWERVRLYPYHTERIMARSAALKPIASLSGSVQERLDGSGYYRGLVAPLLSVSARLLAAADVYQALREDRPVRPARSPDTAARELAGEVTAGHLDREAVDAVLACAGHERRRLSRTWPAGLTDREVEVLRLVATAKPNKSIASQLVISEETVRNHVRHIYEKVGVSSRAGAALFAMEHDLLRKQHLRGER